MAEIVSKPLAIFRRPESSKPLHSRWGDVEISVPTDGSWNQYNNPHRRAARKQSYGPGFVPDDPSARETRPAKDDVHTPNKIDTDEKSSLSRRSSLSLGALRPGRLSVRLASRPKQLRDEVSLERTPSQSDRRTSGYAYKPIQQDYTAELTDKSNCASSAQYRYIPTSRRYLEDIPVSPRSQSVGSHHSSRARRDSFTDSIESHEHSHDALQSHKAPYRTDSHKEEDRHSLRFSLGESSDGSSRRSSYGLLPRRRTSPFVAADRKRASSLKPMTMAMVPDSEDLYE